MVSHTEENYLKAIFKLIEKGNASASTNAISKEMQTSAASVTDMLKRLADKQLINYEKYKGVTLTGSGKKIATTLIRKHRLWEVFLVNKLNFAWDEVHEIAEEMEHIQSDELIDRLDSFLGKPKVDPHGDPIPDADGNFAFKHHMTLTEIGLNQSAVVVGVKEHSATFLQYLDQIGLGLGSNIEVLEYFDYDGSLRIKLNKDQELILSLKVGNNLFVQNA